MAQVDMAAARSLPPLQGRCTQFFVTIEQPCLRVVQLIGHLMLLAQAQYTVRDVDVSARDELHNRTVAKLIQLSLPL
jgi:hypothetical protein